MKALKRAAFGARAHSGWAALVAVAGDIRKPEILDRRRISLIDPSPSGAIVAGRGPEQPYHVARELKLEEARAYLALSAITARRFAISALKEAAAELGLRGFRVVGCGIVLASGRSLPPLEKILGSHPMIHTAEGEFFRNAIREACQEVEIGVTGVRARELFDRAAEKFRLPALKIKRRVKDLGRTAGRPWTTDQINASVAAFLALQGQKHL